VLEAERACDDAVLRHTEPTAYADQLVVLAQRLAIDSNQRSIAMANNSDLATRVRAVLDNRQPRGRAGGFCVALVGITAAAVVFTVSGLQIVTAAQAPQMPQWQKIAGGKMSFEVASVRPSQERNFGRFLFNTDEFYRPTGGLFAASVPLRIYIEFAYKLRPSN
jgi:hypothetical protein